MFCKVFAFYFRQLFVDSIGGRSIVIIRIFSHPSSVECWCVEFDDNRSACFCVEKKKWKGGWKVEKQNKIVDNKLWLSLVQEQERREYLEVFPLNWQFNNSILRCLPLLRANSKRHSQAAKVSARCWNEFSLSPALFPMEQLTCPIWPGSWMVAFCVWHRHCDTAQMPTMCDVFHRVVLFVREGKEEYRKSIWIKTIWTFEMHETCSNEWMNTLSSSRSKQAKPGRHRPRHERKENKFEYFLEGRQDKDDDDDVHSNK